jgi:2-polyprenyl-3-methyl-5-hydroxy-6-metoxy-1,4-benzoquinol methylase
MELEETSCPLCGSKKKAKAYPNFFPYQVVRCQSCNFYYLSPRPTEYSMLQLYSEDTYFEGEGDGYNSYLEQELALRTTFRRLMENLKKHKITGGTLLEVGCGYGYLLDEAKEFFNIRVGTDFSSQAVERAKQRADRIYQGGVDQIPVEEKFDCIIATQVIEHVYQPKTFLQQLLDHLKPGGKIVIATPNMGSFWRKFMGHRWPSFKMPEHILYFDQKSLFTLMQQVGLIGIKPLPYPHAFPVPLIAAKLNLTLPSMFDKLNLWLPATTLALYGIAPK